MRTFPFIFVPPCSQFVNFTPIQRFSPLLPFFPPEFSAFLPWFTGFPALPL